MNAFDRLLIQVDSFIRKYYKNLLVKGILLFIGILLLTYLLIVTLEFFGRFNSLIRAILFFSFIIINGIILARYIVVPSLKLNSFGARISRYQASIIIGKFFPTVSDRLLNTLQLSKQMNANSADYELLAASVQQRSKELVSVPFTDAVDLRENRKFLTWLLPMLLIMLSIGLFAPKFFLSGTKRVVNFSKEFPIEAPFKFILETELNPVQEGEDFPFSLRIKGDELPEKIYVVSSQGKFLLDRVTKNSFQGKLGQMRNRNSFQFIAKDGKGNEHKSVFYMIDIIAKAAIGKLQATVRYPAYLGMKNDTIDNVGDLNIPEGAVVSWSVLTKHTQESKVRIGKRRLSFKESGYSFSEKIGENTDYQIDIKSSFSEYRDSVKYKIDVNKDQFPSINVEEIEDSLKDGVRYFSGLVADDHGITSLRFVYVVTSKNGKVRKESINVVQVRGSESPFHFAVDFRRENIALEDQIEYYFVVQDNDGVNGSKSTKSKRFLYQLPTLEELNEKREDEQEQIKNKLESALDRTNEFQKSIEQLKKNAMNARQADWKKQNQAQLLQEEHQSIIEELQQIQDKIENSTDEKNQLSEIDEELLKQQELIEELLKELMDDELKDLLKELEELLNEQNKDKLQENFEKLEISSEDMKKQMDRSLEMLKRLQVNEKIDDIESELEKLAKEQKELKNSIEERKEISDGDMLKQDDINRKFEELKDDIRQLDSLNNALKNPLELGNPEEKTQEISDELNDSKENLEKNKGSKASESQQSAAEKMDKLAKELDQKQQESNQQQQEEDMTMLRNILEGLIALSFNQEGTMNKLRGLNEADPAYRNYARNQRNIIDDTKIIRDSLQALALRQPKIASFIDKELNNINVNHDLALEDIDERRKRDLLVHQQFAMTSYNNLALMLNESLQQMQQQMQQQSEMQGSGSCKKPGGKGKPKPGDSMNSGDMKEMIKKQLEDMKKGANPGGKEPGKSGSGGQGEMMLGNEKVAKMAAEQALIRKRLEQLKNELNKDGQGRGNQLNPLLDELKKQQDDLINKKLSNNLVKRQQDILTRLLESEKALKERGWDEKRESTEGKSENNGNQIRFDEYNKEKLRQIELLRSVDPTYNKYYKDRANEYFNRVL